VKKYAEQLEQANIRLEEIDRLKSVFLASMSHELRTPLNSIIGFTDIILLGISGEVNEEQGKQLTIVKSSADHLLSLIDDILDISKIEADAVKLSPEEFNLDDVVSEVVESLSPTASEKGLEIIAEVPEGITLFTDRRRVKQVLMNLGSNAVKFTDQGSVKIATRVPGDENLEVRVIDTGVGIKKEDMEKLFQPFQQIDVSLTKKHEGTLLGGDISAKSEYGRGSEFTFTIPLRYEEAKRNEKNTGS
jgi:signal transduction histidine kinase